VSARPRPFVPSGSAIRTSCLKENPGWKTRPKAGALRPASEIHKIGGTRFALPPYNLFKASELRRTSGHEEERAAGKQVSLSTDRRQNQGTGRLAGRDAQPAACRGQESRSRDYRGVEVAR